MKRGLFIEMQDGTQIINFKYEDEFCIREQIFMEFGEWSTLVYQSPFYMFNMKPRKWFLFKEQQ